MEVRLEELAREVRVELPGGEGVEVRVRVVELEELVRVVVRGAGDVKSSWRLRVEVVIWVKLGRPPKIPYRNRMTIEDILVNRRKRSGETCM